MTAAGYSALEDELQGQDFALLVRDHNMDFDRAGLARCHRADKPGYFLGTPSLAIQAR